MKFILNESLLEKDIRKAMSKVYQAYEKYNENDGNQNCMMCAWALEMQLRGNRSFLPRPVYSPRDVVFTEIAGGWLIVKKPRKIGIKNKLSVIQEVEEADEGARFYCHVNWQDSTGGHEFLVLNIEGKAYVADAQANTLNPVEDDHTYFEDINWDNSLLVRLDNKEINDDILKYNDDKYILEWDDELDLAFLEGEKEVSEEFDPPYNEEQIKANYGDETYQRLIDDPAHAWRMKTGLELIHKEPSKKELERIWANWQEMTDEQKAESDKKSIELFRKTNAENYNELIKLYESAENESKLYCISQEDLDGQTLEPRVPDNFFTKNGYEDGETPRVCFTPSIDKCLMAISQKCEGIEFYVFSPEEVPEENIYKPTIEEVPDTEITDETWITCPVKLKKVGKIKVLGDSGLDGHPFNYGDKTAELYDWDWEWLEQSV